MSVISVISVFTRFALLLLVGCSSPSRPTAPDPHNLGFEILDGTTPAGWHSTSGPLATDPTEKHGGARALVIEGDRVASASLDATPYRGKRMALRGWIKTADSDGAMLWLRADAGAETVGFDSMADRLVVGTAEWTQASVEIDVPPAATSIVVAGQQIGSGRSWFDDLAFDVSELAERAKPPVPIVLEGVVVDSVGSPASGAEVAVLDYDGDMPKHVRADKRGRFQFDVSAGTWSISAHGAGGVGALLPEASYDRSTRDLRITLGKNGGVTVRGKLSRNPNPGTYLRVSGVSLFDAEPFAVPVRDDGTFEVVMPQRNEYLVEVLGSDVSDTFERTAEDHVDVVLDTTAMDPPPADVVAYIEKHGIPLVSVEAGTGFDDMAAISKLVGKARIVALGEATHGSREIFQLKHRMLEYLVAEQGFTVFAIEANAPECRAINEYVLHGRGNAKAALLGIQLWPWKTQEVLAMIEWMRAWNAGHDRKVHFAGFDMQFSGLAYETVAAFVTKEAPGQAKALLAPISILGTGTARVKHTLQKASPEQRTALLNGLTALGPVLARADPDTRHDLQILVQAATMYMESTHQGARDRAMAENVAWLHDHTKARIAVWAHNAHISKTEPQFPTMGSFLRTKFERDYLSIGFVFGEGAFRAVDLSKPSRPIAEHTLGPPPESHASAAFARTGKPLLVLDLRALPRSGTVANWFAAPHAVRDISAAFLDVNADTFRTVLPERFDAVIYIDKTTSSRPIEN